MSTFFSINENLNISLGNGTAYCILEETRKLFDDKYNACLDEIYEGYDVGMNLVIFDEVNEECYNYFYQKCKAAMKYFPYCEHSNGMEPALIDGIMAGWVELLDILKKDPRYRDD